MLIIKRKAGESITIKCSEQIKIEILGDHGSVKLGIHAPRHVRIFRDEEPLEKLKSNDSTHEDTRP